MNNPSASIASDELCEVAEIAARAAGDMALGGFRGVMDVRSKGGQDIVTEYDTAAEEAAMRVIMGRYPDHKVLAEESGASGSGHAGAATYLWTIDPIDGTHNYAMQLPFWCASVAVASAEGVQATVIYDALHGELFKATLHGGAFLNGKQIRVSDKSEPGEAILACDIGYESEVARRMMALSGWMQPQVKRLRLLGSAVLAMAYVAAGRFDSYYHLSLQPWDIAGASLLVAEAGGTITDWDNKPLAAGKTSAVAANKALHPHILRLLHAGESRAR